MPQLERTVILPKEIAKGEEYKKTFDFGKYPNADGWDMQIIGLNAANKFEETATPAGGNTYAFDEAQIDWVAGYYNWHATMVQTPGDRTAVIGFGGIQVLPDYREIADSGTPVLDDRSFWKTTLDNLDQFIIDKSKKDVAEYTIAGRTLKSYTSAEIIEWRNFAAARFTAECRRQRLREGRESGNKIKAQVISP